MTRLLILTLGEWLEANGLGLIVAVVGWLSSAAVLVWKGSQLAASAHETKEAMDALAEAFEHQRNAFQSHVANAEMHTNRLHMQDIEKRIDKLEASFESGVTKINDKLDRLSERLHK